MSGTVREVTTADQIRKLGAAAEEHHARLDLVDRTGVSWVLAPGPEAVGAVMVSTDGEFIYARAATDGQIRPYVPWRITLGADS